MGVQVLTDALVLVNGADLSGNSNKVEVTGAIEELDATTFGSAGWKEYAAGLGSHEWSVEGFWSAGDVAQPDDRLWLDLGVEAAWTAAASQVAGSVAYLGKVVSGQHKVGGDVGSLAPFAATGQGSGRLVRGTLVHAASVARTATGNGTAYQLGALSSTQRMWCALHVCSVAGTTPAVVVKLQSAATAGGSYTDRITFSSANSVSSQLASAAGAVADTWWRAQYTITGTGPSFLLGVAAGVA